MQVIVIQSVRRFYYELLGKLASWQGLNYSFLLGTEHSKTLPPVL